MSDRAGSDRAGRGISRKNAGLLLALAFSLIAAGVVLFFMVGNKTRRDGSVAPASADIGNPDAPPTPPIPTLPGGGAANSFGAVQTTGRARLQFIDSKDASRIASEMEWLSLEPLEQRGRSLISEPRFWIYPEGGQTIHIQAAHARIFQPDQQSEPESGRLEGTVLLRLFAAGPDGRRRQIDIEKDQPLALMVTDSLNFDAPIGEVSTIDPWQISTAEIDAAGVGLRIQVNELRQRLELLEVDRGGSIRYSQAATPTRSGRADPSPTDPTPSDPAAAGDDVAAADPTDPAPPHEDLYRAVFSSAVKVVQGRRTLTADTLEVWTRLIDGGLPDGALPASSKPTASRSPALSPTITSPAALLSAAAMANLQPETTTPSPAPAERDDDILLTWAGALTVRPIEPTPAELTGGNHLALRFTADKTGVVTFADDGVGINGRCVYIDYRATTQDLTLAGPGPAAVTVDTNDGKQVQVGRMELNLGTGVAFIPGGGVLADGNRRITWTDQTDLQFATENGSMTGELRDAAFTGRVLAKNPDGSSVAGDFLRAVFTATQDQATALTRLIVEGTAVADAGGAGGSLRADKLDLLFHPPEKEGGDPEPRILTAVGAVRAERGATSLAAEFLEATLRTDAQANKVIVEDVHALGEVAFQGEDGLAATAEELFANIPRQAARLTGQGASIGQRGDRISGSAIELDGLARRMVVQSAGKFVHAGDPKSRARGLGDSAGSTPMTATWASSMTFDDLTGVVECHGDVAASTDPAGQSVDLARGEHLRIEFTPAEPGSSLALTQAGGAQDPDSPAPAPREFLRAQISGDGESEALVESRSYTPDAAAPEGRRLAQFMRLTGGRILADETAGTLTVPGAGRAAIYDGRSKSDAGEPIAQAPGAQTPGDLLQGGRFSGSALFVWNGSMSVDRAAGLLQLRRAVQMVHRPLGEGAPATMECERLDAAFSTPSTTTAAQPAGSGMELTSALARDAVYFESGGRKLLADAVAYDAAAGTAEATADEGNRVTLYDESRATPVTARRLLWDIIRDRITIREPTPIVTPMTRPR